MESIVGNSGGKLAWRSANVAVEACMQVVISGVDGFVNGTYTAVLQQDSPPVFERRDFLIERAQRPARKWLYLDREGRWRIAMTRQKEARTGATAGFLRSCIVAPGTLPASAGGWEVSCVSPDGSAGWKPCDSCSVTGAAHECEWPDLVLTLSSSRIPDTSLCKLYCTSVGGAEVAHLEVDMEKEHLLRVRTYLSQSLQFPTKKIKLILSDGSLLGEELDSTRVADIFR